MFILLLNLPILDIMGATAFLPQLLHSIVSRNRSIYYPGCFLQALLIHIYGAGNFLFLAAMAYDRYIAICLPLRYHSLMTSHILIRIIVFIWFFNIFITAVLLVFTTIVSTKSLHKPMFILLLNLPILDIMGATAFLPQLLHSIVSRNRSIYYPGCFLQALLIHIYGAGNFLFLAAMAYDRYIAICLPL
ncbi:hypothetical protein CRUP_034506, partial [Coryphaenoides rupestris]